MNYQTDLIWQTHAGNTQQYFRTKIDEIKSLDCFIGTNGITGNRTLLIDFDKAIKLPDFKIQRFRGVEIQLLNLAEKYELAIILMENSLQDIFTLLAEDMLKEIAVCEDQQTAITAAFRVISHWKRMFESLSLSGLTAEQQKGLFGELYFMLQSILAGIEPGIILDGWSGPDALNQDYVINGTGIEVKTTGANHAILQISNELQLNGSHLEKLFIYLIIIDERKGRLLTLNTLISQLHVYYAANPDLTDLFNVKLLKAGYQDGQAKQYDNREYIIRSIKSHRIADGFPCITPPDLPDGIHHVTYQIETAACIDFEITPEELFAGIIS
jgi:hypothetical protein